MDESGCSETGSVGHTKRREETREDSKAMANRTQAPAIMWVHWQDLLRGKEGGRGREASTCILRSL